MALTMEREWKRERERERQRHRKRQRYGKVERKTEKLLEEYKNDLIVFFPDVDGNISLFLKSYKRTT